MVPRRSNAVQPQWPCGGWDATLYPMTIRRRRFRLFATELGPDPEAGATTRIGTALVDPGVRAGSTGSENGQPAAADETPKQAEPRAIPKAGGR